MAYDGSITIDTTINTDGILEGVREINSKQMALISTIKKTQRELDAWKKKMDELSGKKIPTQEYKEVDKQLQKLRHDYDVLLTRKERLESTGAKKGKAFQGLESQLQTLAKNIEYVKSEKEELEKSGKGFTMGKESSEYQKAADKVQTLSDRVNVYERRLEEADAKQDGVAKGLNKIGQHAKKNLNTAKKHTESFGSSIGKAMGKLAGMFKMMIMFQVIGNIISSLGDYISGLISQDTQLSKSLAQLKYNLQVAFQPIWETILPALRGFISMLSQAMGYVAKFIAQLTGKSVKSSEAAVNAYNKQAKGLDKVSKSAKKANHQLNSYDKLNVRKEDKEEDTDEDEKKEYTPTSIGDTSKIEKSLKKIKELLKPVVQYSKKLAKNFKKGFKEGLGDTKVFGNIKKNCSSIGNSLKEIFTDPKVSGAADKLATSIATFFGRLAGSMVSIAASIVDNLTGGIAKYLEENKEYIKEKLVNIFTINADSFDLAGQFFVAVADILTVLRSDIAKAITANIIGIFTNAFLGVHELSARIGNSIRNLLLGPIIDNKDKIKETLLKLFEPIEKFTGTLKDMVTDFFDTMNEKYEEYIEPAVKSIRETTSKVLGILLDAIQEHIVPLMNHLADKFNELYQNHLKPLFEKLGTAIGKVARTVAKVWEIVGPILANIDKWVIGKAVPFLKTFGDLIMNVFGVVADIFGTVLDVLGDLLDIVFDLFSLDFAALGEDFKNLGQHIIDGLVSGLSGIWEAIKGLFQGIIDGFCNLFGINSPSTVFAEFGGFIIQGLVDGVKGLINLFIKPFKGAWKKIKEVFSGVKSWFSEKFSAAWEGIKSIFSNPGEFFAGVWGRIKEAFGAVKGWFKRVFGAAWEGIKSIFSNPGEFFSNVWEKIKSAFSGAAKWFKELGKKMWDGIKGAFEKVSEFFGGAWEGAKEFFGASSNTSVSTSATSAAAYSVNSYAVPRLATGTVIPPNKEFLAVLGDQKSGTNVEAPLATIEKAMFNALAKAGLGDITLAVTLDGDVVYKSVVKRDKQHIQKAGKSELGGRK
ncbi:MAG: hypothetical protein NC293_10090 [Roseburia sp.]|nr:hypothetical protein [Roseburia sp.]